MRFLQIQIYNKQGTEIEYDNAIDDTWGIQSGSASLETLIMEDELKFGESNASKFEVEVFGIDDDLSHRKIKVNILEDEETNYIITDKDNVIVTHDGTRLIHHTSAGSDLFFGEIQSTKKDRLGTYRDIVAYDAFYELRDFNMIDFWNAYWSTHEEVTLLEFKQAIFIYVNLPYIHQSALNDDLVIHNPVEGQQGTVLKFGDLLRIVYQLQNASPHILGTGYVTDVTLEGVSDFDNIRDLRGDLEGENSSWEDFETEQITGIGVYSTGDALAQVVGNDGNVYNIVGNLFLLDMSAQEIESTCQPLLTQLQDYIYTPGEFKLKLPRKRLKLGDLLKTDYGFSYAFKIRYSGSVLINETVSCEVKSATLNKDVTSLDDVQFIGNKYAILTKDIDGLHTEFGNLEEEVHSEIEQTTSQIVLKVDDNGDIVEVALGTDPDDGTVFQVKARNIDLTAEEAINLLAGGDLNLTGKNVTITSTNFSVTSGGQITAKRGVIGGWTITDNKIYGGDGNTGVAFMQTPASNTTYVFGAGGASHDDYSDCKFRVSKDGSIYSALGFIGGWNISTGKISAGDNTTGVAVMQAPSSNITWVFGAGGTSHTSYANCKFKVSKNGAIFANGINLTEGTATGDDALGYFSVLDDSTYGGVRVRNTANTRYAAMYGNSGIYTNGEIQGASLYITGAKHRIVNTDDYGDRLLYCYETPTPMFGDIGEGKIAEDGKCYVWLDPVFTETIANNHYQVFLQKYGNGDCWVSERTPNYFVVEGDVDLQFGWELKARQKDFENKRLEHREKIDIEGSLHNYGIDAIEHIQKVSIEREVIIND